MTATSFTLPAEKHSAWFGGALVGAVTLVLGFGSGIGSIISHQRTSYQASGPVTADGATPTPEGVAVAVGSGNDQQDTTIATSPHDHGSGAAASRDHTGTSLTGVAMTGGAPAPAGAAMPAAPAAACQPHDVVSAMAAPLMTHLNKAHLETSPGQQVADLLNLDQYTKTHTVLLESILAPLMDVVTALPAGVTPLMTHLNKAHLETSPGQQVADLLSVDQYVKTHTVLAEAILAPTLDTAMGKSGC